MTEEQKQKRREANKQYRDNMTKERKQKQREYDKRYKDNMTDEQNRNIEVTKENT